MVLHQIREGTLEHGIYTGIGSNDGALMAIAARQVLTGDDSHTHPRGFEQYQLGVVIGKKAFVYGLHDERPQAQSLLRSLVIEQQLYVRDLTAAPQVIEAAYKLLTD